MSSLAGRLLSAWHLIAKRSLAHWRVLVSVVLGVLLASTIISGTVIYFDALRDLALNQALEKSDDQELDILITGDRGPTTRSEHALLSGLVGRYVDSRVGHIVQGTIHAGKTPTMFLTQPGKEHEAGKYNSRSYFAFVRSLEDHVTILPGGRFPRNGLLSSPGETPRIEAIVQRDVAITFGLDVGDSMSAIPFWSDATPVISVVIAGIFDKNDFDDDIWYLEEKVLDASTGSSFRTAAFYLSETGYLDGLGPTFSRLSTTYAWLLDVDNDRVTARNAGAVLDSLEDLTSQLTAVTSGHSQKTALAGALREYDRKLFFSKLPMYVVMIFISVVILYYVVTLSALAIEERRNEVALLRSRGATPSQMLAVFALEGFTIVVLAVAAGPLLAAAVTSFLGLTPAFSGLTGGERLEVSLSLPAYLMSALGGVLSFAAVMAPAVQASRMNVTRQRQSAARPATTPVFQRYYVDVLLVVVSIYLFRQLGQQGSVVAKEVLGDVAVDQLLLALPGLMLVAAGMALLRLFPLAMTAASRTLSRLLPAGLAMGVWQMARNPTHYARLSLLLILTAGLGIFASSFGATLARSFEERILYSTGSDIRVQGIKPVYRTRWDYTRQYGLNRVLPQRHRAVITPYERFTKVDALSPVLRDRGSEMGKTFGTSYEMLAVDPETVLDVAWFRDDFADKPITELIAGLPSEAQPSGILMPDEAYIIGARVKANRPHPSLRFTARLQNAQGQFTTYTLGTLDSDQWVDLEASLQFGVRQSMQLSRPLNLVSLRIEETGDRRLQAGSILIDDVWAIDAWTGKTVLEGFDGVDGWTVMRASPDAGSDTLRQSDATYNGSATALFSWSEGSAGTARGVFRGSTSEHVPVLASTSFARATGRGEGEEFEVSVSGFRVPVRLAATVDLFPTMTAQDEKFLVADLNSLTRYANMAAYSRELLPNEMWISSSTTGEERAELVKALGNARNVTSSIVFDRSIRLDEAQVDPLVEAGWRALLFLAFSAVLLLSCLGFAIHAYVSFRNRQLQFALLRTVGLSGRQMLAMIWLEQILVVAVGMALGMWMGGRLGATIMPFLGHDDWGTRVIPPFVMEVDWNTLAVTYGAMVLVFAIITLGLLWLIHRISLHRVLRLGEM